MACPFQSYPKHLRLGVQPVVALPYREHCLRVIPVAVVERPRVLLRKVGTGGIDPGIGVQDGCVRMGGDPINPRRSYHGQEFQPDAAVGQGPHRRFAKKLVPQSLGRAVIHQLVAAVQHTGGAELQNFAVDLGGIHDSRAAEGSIGQGEGYASNHVVGHLVGVEYAVRIGPVLAVE